MAIAGIGGNYHSLYGSTCAAQRKEAAKRAEKEEAETARAENAEIKNDRADDAAEYYSRLQKNFSCVRNGSVTISGTYLNECARDPKKAEELEESLSYFQEGYENGWKSARANAAAIGARVVNYSESWSIDSRGNITMMASTTVTSGSGVKGWKELAEEREEKWKEKEEKLKKKKEKEQTVEKKKEQREKEKVRLEELRLSAQPVSALPDAYHRPIDIKA